MISIVDTFRYVFGYMNEKKSRVFLTISGIIIGIFTFTFFIFASAGLSNAITAQFSAFGLNVLAIEPAGTATTGPPSGAGLTDSDVSKIKQVVKDYKYVAPVIFHIGQYEYGREKKIINSLAYPEEYWDDLGQDMNLEKLYSGRMIRQGDSGVAVLGYKTATKVFKKDIQVGSSLKIGNKNLRVIGILDERGDFAVDNALLMSFSDMKEISGQDTYSAIRVSFEDNVDLNQMQQNIEQKFNKPNKEKVIQIISPQQMIDQFDMIIGMLQMIIGFISSIALMVGGINVMNTMYSNVIERTNEISVMKAMGAQNSDIRNLFLVESGMLGLIGALIGFILSYALAEFLSYFITNFLGYNVPLHFELSFFLEVIITTTFFAMLFGTYPAIRAARVLPGDNLRDE